MMLIGIVPGTCGPGHTHPARFFICPNAQSCDIFQAQYVCVIPNYTYKFIYHFLLE